MLYYKKVSDLVKTLAYFYQIPCPKCDIVWTKLDNFLLNKIFVPILIVFFCIGPYLATIWIYCHQIKQVEKVWPGAPILYKHISRSRRHSIIIHLLSTHTLATYVHRRALVVLLGVGLQEGIGCLWDRGIRLCLVEKSEKYRVWE